MVHNNVEISHHILQVAIPYAKEYSVTHAVIQYPESCLYICSVCYQQAFPCFRYSDKVATYFMMHLYQPF